MPKHGDPQEVSSSPIFFLPTLELINTVDIYGKVQGIELETPQEKLPPIPKDVKPEQQVMWQLLHKSRRRLAWHLLGNTHRPLSWKERSAIFCSPKEDVSEVLVCYALGVYKTQSNPQVNRVIA